MRKDKGSARKDTILDVVVETQPGLLHKSSSIQKLFASRSIKHKEDLGKQPVDEFHESNLCMFDSLLNLEKSTSVASEISFEESASKRRVYDFRPLTASKLGSLFFRGVNLSSNATSHHVLTTDSGGVTASQEPAKVPVKAGDSAKIFFGSLSMAETKTCKLRTVDPSLIQHPEIEIIRPSSINKHDQSQQGSSLAITPLEPREVYSNFLNRLNFTSLMEGGERIIKEITKTVVAGGKSTSVCCITWENGSTYEGEIVGMKFNGFGVLNHHTGYCIRGNFVDGRIHGYAEYTRDKVSYVGQWVNNLPHGHGVERVDGSFSYEGSLAEGIKHGKGKMTIDLKGKYEGEFKHSMFHGQGVFTWLDGRKYSGNWAHNLMHGKGVMTWPDGRKFEGRYMRSKKDGPGVFTWADGRICYGVWKDGKQQGTCKYTTLIGEKCHRKWEDGVQEEGHRLSQDNDR